MDDVVIVGAGIGGLTLGLAVHAAGIPCRIFESAADIRAVGVGINLLPHATKELAALGLEPALALYIKALIEPGHITWMKLIEMMTIAPAKIAALKKGTLALGVDGDVTIIDPHREWTVDVEEFNSRSRNCPFGGWKLKGRATHTIVAGDVKWELAQ
jgi:N-acyl-D-aspartate/D-glutamate deacylase